MLFVGYFSGDELSTFRIKLLRVLSSRSISPPRYIVIEYDGGIKHLGTNAQCLSSNVRASPAAHSYLMHTRTTLSVPVSSAMDRLPFDDCLCSHASLLKNLSSPQHPSIPHLQVARGHNPQPSAKMTNLFRMSAARVLFIHIACLFPLFEQATRVRPRYKCTACHGRKDI